MNILLFWRHSAPLPVGSVYSVEVALDLTELEMLTEQRRNVRDALEKSIALWKATGSPYVIIVIIVIILVMIIILITVVIVVIFFIVIIIIIFFIIVVIV